MVLKKHDIENALYEEHKDISAGRLKEENPLDLSDGFKTFCEACRRGDLKVCQEKLQDGVDINARDPYDYTPLILVSDPLDSDLFVVRSPRSHVHKHSNSDMKLTQYCKGKSVWPL